MTDLQPAPARLASVTSTTIADAGASWSLGRWFCLSVLLMPLVALVHELGHFLVAWGFGRPGLRLHVLGVSYAGGDALKSLILSGDLESAAKWYPLWQEGIIGAAGPAMSSVLVISICALILWRGPLPMLVLLGLLANFRTAQHLHIRLTVVVNSLFGSASDLSARSGDETMVAALTGIPLVLLDGISILLFGLSLVVILSPVQRANRTSICLTVWFGALLGLLTSGLIVSALVA